VESSGILIQAAFTFCFGAGAALCIPLTIAANRWAERSDNLGIERLPGLPAGMGATLALAVLVGLIAPGVDRLAWVGGGLLGCAVTFAYWRFIHQRRHPLPPCNCMGHGAKR